MTTRRDTGLGAPGGDDRGDLRVERVVESCLADVERFGAATLDALCAAHPSEAAALRRQFAALRAAGLLGLPLHAPRLADSAATWDTDARGAVTDPEAAKRFSAIGPYQPLKELGRGGQAVVYLAEDLRLHRPVALKVLTGLGPLSETVIRRFRREAEVASQLDHPGICAVYDAGVKDEVPYIAMRYVAGVTLADRIEACRPDAKKGIGIEKRRAADEGSSESQVTLSVGSHVRREIHRVLEVLEKAARALHAAHEAGVVHRDVKPGNIMVTPEGEPVLLDFGLAGDAEQGLQTLTETGEMMGTPAYMSPEQLMAKRIRLDRRTDVYSLGATLFECLTLRRPYVARTRERMYEAIQYKDPLDVLKLNPRLPADVKVVVETALEKDRDRRYQTAEELAEDLRRVRAGEPIAARPIGAVGRAWRWAKRRPGRAALLLVLALGIPAVAGLGGYIAANMPRIREAAAQAHRDQVEELLGRGYLELAEWNLNKALTGFEKVFALESDNQEAIAGKAFALLQQRKFKILIDYLDANRDQEAELPVLVRVRLMALRGLGAAGEVEDVQRRGIPRPKTPLGHCLESRLLTQWLGLHALYGGTLAFAKIEKAIDHASRAVLGAAAPRSLYHFALVRALEVRADMVRASARRWWPSESPLSSGDEAELRRGAVATMKARWPDSTQTWLHIARGLIHEDPKAALAACERSLELGSENSGAYSCRARILNQRMNKFAEAEAAARRAVELWPENAFHRMQLAMAFYGQGRTEECLDRLREAVELAPEPAYVHAQIGRLLWNKGRLAESLAEFRRAAESSPDVPGYAYYLALHLRDLGRNHEAIPILQRVLELEPGDLDTLINLGTSLILTGDLERARVILERAVELKPNNALAHWNLSLAHSRSGAFRNALDCMRQAKRIGFASLSLTLAGDPERKLGEMKERVELEPKLAEVIAGSAEPAGPREAIQLAWMAQDGRRNVLASRLFELGFDRNDALEKEGLNRVWAARAAALAGAGVGHDAATLDDSGRARRRRHALAWLKEELVARKRALWDGRLSKITLIGILNRWRESPALAGIREPATLAARSPEERQGFEAFWAEVDELIVKLMKGE